MEKEPLKDERQFDKILEVATREGEEARKLVLLLMKISEDLSKKLEMQVLIDI